MVSSLERTALAAIIAGVMNGFEIRGEREIDLRGACLSSSEDRVVVKRWR